MDDIPITVGNLELIKKTKASLQQTFKIKDLGDLRYFLGIELARSSQEITMHQRKYALELIFEIDLSAAKPFNTPIDSNIKLTSKQYDQYIGINSENDPLVNQERYQKLIGKLLYLTVTRPNIAYSVQTLSQFLQEPKQYHMDAALRIVKYIKSQPGLGSLMSSKSINEVTAYCDTD